MRAGRSRVGKRSCRSLLCLAALLESPFPSLSLEPVEKQATRMRNAFKVANWKEAFAAFKELTT